MNVFKLIFLCLFTTYGISVIGQDTINTNKIDTLPLSNSIADTLTILNKTLLDKTKDIDSIYKIANRLSQTINLLNDSILILNKEANFLKINNNELQEKLNETEKVVNEKDKLVEQQIKNLQDKERILSEKEQLYKLAMFNSKIDSIGLASKLHTKNIELQNKQNITKLLEQNIDEKKNEIEKRNKELEKIKIRSEAKESELWILKDSLTELRIKLAQLEKDKILLFDKNDVKTKEVKRLSLELYNYKNKDKNKKVRIVQGVAIKTFRTPEYELAPKDVNNINVYVINNKNSGNFEIDYITGASIKIIDLFDKKQPSSDLSIFIGFGGKNLFKNYYVGPNIKLFNVLHLNLGFNLHEYETLKLGFKEGDPLSIGTPIPTNNEWKLNGYIGITLDLAVASGILKKK